MLHEPQCIMHYIYILYMQYELQSRPLHIVTYFDVWYPVINLISIFKGKTHSYTINIQYTCVSDNRFEPEYGRGRYIL